MGVLGIESTGISTTVVINKSQLGNCDINFLNFCDCQVWNFKISNLYEWNWNFAIIFWKYRRQNWKSTKYITTESRQSIIPLKLSEIMSVLWNLVNFCKISQFLVKFGKSLKDLRKILLKWLVKTVKYQLNFINFCSCTEKWPKVGQTLSVTLTKAHGIQLRFPQS